MDDEVKVQVPETTVQEATAQEAVAQEAAVQEATAQETMPQAPAGTKPRRRRRKVIAVVLGFVVLGLCAFVFYIDSTTQVGTLDPPDRDTETTDIAHAPAYANHPFVLKGTVLGMQELPSDEEVTYGYYNNAPILFLLDMRIDKVYAGDGYGTGDKVQVLYSVNRTLYQKSGAISQLGPVMEAGRSYVLFCNLSADAEQDARYVDLIAQSDLYVLSDLFSFPVKDDYVCVWIGLGWKAAYPPTVELNDDESREFNTGLFSCMVRDEEISPQPVAYYYSDDDFASAIEYLRTQEHEGVRWGSFLHESLS
jgi:hypothetical protein